MDDILHHRFISSDSEVSINLYVKILSIKNPVLTKTFVSASVGGVLFGVYLHNRHQWPLINVILPSIDAAQRIDIDYKPPSLRSQFNFVADVLENVEKSVVNIELVIPYYRQTMSNGSGFIATDDGLIITNAHVTLPDGSKHKGAVEALDVECDLAIIRCNFPNNYPALKLGKAADIRNGEFVIAMGSPLTLNNTNTFGIISNKQRSSETLGLNKTINYIQTDAAITFGNSGGPLVNLDGEVIGINSMKVTAGISFAIPIDYAIEFLTNYKRKDKDRTITHKKYIGITMLTLNEKLIEQLRRDRHIPYDLTHGVLIWRVMYNSPAYLAGLHQEDIIIELNNKPCHTAKDIYAALESTDEKPLELLVIRSGAKFLIKVTPSPSV
ncbi:hypothetical protein M8J75_009763 [Diaphorina citri]|nr:hypothetical protein M8J75_009763 [Diaphorina citri]